MKKAFFTIAAMIATCGVFAQTETTTTTTKTTEKTAVQQGRHPNGYMMKDGKLMMIKDGNMMLVQKDITLSNGTVIMADGSYMEKGRTKTKFKDGDHINMDGTMTSMKKSK